MYPKIINLLKASLLIILLPCSGFASVDKTPIPQEEVYNKVLTFDWTSSDLSSQINIINSKASLDLSSFYYVDILDNYSQVQQLMYWSNGIEYPRTTHYLDIYLTDDSSYTVNIDKFIDDGFIKGDDWNDVDAEKFLKELRQASIENNKVRIKNGYSAVEDINWHIKPYYNKTLGYVFYSLLVKFDNGSETYNSTAMVLGRKGYTDITFLFKDNIAHLMPAEIDKVVKSFQYNQGLQYSDFKSGDKIAAYGVGALVAGSLGIKGLAKAGILVALAAFAKKLWFILLLPFIYLFRLFTGNKKNS